MKFMRHSKRTHLGIVAAVFIAVAAIAPGGVAYAQESTDDSRQIIEEKKAAAQQRAEEAKLRAQQRAEEAKANALKRAEEAKQRAQSRASETKQRLEGAKLKACEAREKRISATMAQMTKRGENHIAVFTKISDRVKAFYEKKGHTAEDYDMLVAEVDTKKASAEAAVASAQSVGDVFSCDSDNPKIASEQFREAHKAQVAALKEYRTAVKNLIVAVKSAQSQAENTESDTPASGETTNE